MTSAPMHGNDTPSYAQRRRRWQEALSTAAHLSNRFRERYANVLAQMEALAPHEAVQTAHAIAGDDPHRAGELLAGRAPVSSPARAAVPLSFDGDPHIVGLLRPLLGGSVHIEDFMASQPPLAQTAVPIHPSRRARVLRSGDRLPQDLVALVWSAESVAERQGNAALLASVLPAVDGTGRLRFTVQSDYALVRTEDSADPWVFSPNLGETLEDELRSGALPPGVRAAVLIALRGLRRA